MSKFWTNWEIFNYTEMKVNQDKIDLVVVYSILLFCATIVVITWISI